MPILEDGNCRLFCRQAFTKAQQQIVYQSQHFAYR